MVEYELPRERLRIKVKDFRDDSTHTYTARDLPNRFRSYMERGIEDLNRGQKLNGANTYYPEPHIALYIWYRPEGGNSRERAAKKRKRRFR